MKDVFSIEDLRQRAKRRVPKLMFDFIDGGAGNEGGIRRNREGFSRFSLCPRYFRDVSKRSLETTVFGRTYGGPIGVAPVGLANAIWPGTDAILAELCRDANVPYIISTGGTTALEKIVKIAPDHAWYQLYVSEDEELGFAIMDRAKNAGIDVMILTVDIPAPSLRYRDRRNGFAIPFKPSVSSMIDLATKWEWITGTMRHGQAKFENFAPHMPPDAGVQAQAGFMAKQVSGRMGLDRLKRIRDAWDGHFVIKGIQSTDDVHNALAIGADGVIVSNHGGRQLDSAPSTIEVLGDVVDAAADRLTVMMDSGVREGADIVKAFCLGASMTFSGRSFVFGAAGGGKEGAGRAFEIFRSEVDHCIGQIGATSLKELDRSFLWKDGRARNY